MPDFMFVYRTHKGARAATPEDVAAWQAFLDGLGSSLVDAGNPVVQHRAVNGRDTGTMIVGYSVVRASDMDAAVAMAQPCPALRDGGVVELAELSLVAPAGTATTPDDLRRARQKG